MQVRSMELENKYEVIKARERNHADIVFVIFARINNVCCVCYLHPTIATVTFLIVKLNNNIEENIVYNVVTTYNLHHNNKENIHKQTANIMLC